MKRWARDISRVILTALGLLTAAAAAEPPYVTQGLCDGLPRIPVTTTSEICVGLVASGFEYPRGILVLDNGDLLVADMGAWKPNRGSLWLLQKASSGYERAACWISSTGRMASPLVRTVASIWAWWARRALRAVRPQGVRCTTWSAASPLRCAADNGTPSAGQHGVRRRRESLRKCRLGER